MNAIEVSFQCLESTTVIDLDITRESWFLITKQGDLVRRTLYKAYDGSVVAIKDEGAVPNYLFVDRTFYDICKETTRWKKIQQDSGVRTVNKIKFFYMR